MADYKDAFVSEPGTLGVEGVFGIVPPQGAFSISENDFRAPSLAHFANRRMSKMSVDEVDLLEAAEEEVKHRRLRPLKELELLDTKIQAADKALAESGGFMRALGATLRRYNVSMPAVTVEYRNLTVRTDALMGSAGLPTVGNSLLSFMKGLVCMKQKTVDHAILDKLSGVIRPGRPTLLLGPPASGKSTLLKVLAGRYRNGNNLRITGELLYNGCTQNEFVVERTAAYVDQHDNHIPILSVIETLEFAHTCQLGTHGDGFNLPAELRKAARDARERGNQIEPPKTDGMTDEDMLKLLDETFGSGVNTLGAMRVMGISHCANTPVGDAMLRGVSGGERKRVTTAEMLVGARRVLLLDEISTGLDSATLYSISDVLCNACRLFNVTMVVSLLQPAPEVYNLFDDVILMSAGHVTFHGPVGQALPFYESLGFVRPPRKDVPSFLQEVATASGQHELAGSALKARMRKESQSPPPQQQQQKEQQEQEQQQQPQQQEQRQQRGESEEELGCSTGSNWLLSPDRVVEAYWSSDAGREMTALLSKRFDKATGNRYALVRRRYALTALEALVVVVRRQMLLVLRDQALMIGRLVQVIVIGLITGSLFLQLDHDVRSSRQFFSVAFLAVMFMAMGAMPVVPVTMATKGVWFKHRAACFYPPWCHALGANLAQVPASMVDSMVYSIIVYFMVGFHTSAGQFFLFYLVMASFAICSTVLFSTYHELEAFAGAAPRALRNPISLANAPRLRGVHVRDHLPLYAETGRLIAYCSPNPVVANAYGGLILLILILLSGFSIVRGSIPDYWIWAYYISPFAWALRCVVINEFTSPSWNSPIPGGEGQTVGERALGTFDFFTTRDWYWAGIGYMWALTFLLIGVSAVALTYLSGEPPVARVADPKQLAKARQKAEKARQEAEAGARQAAQANVAPPQANGANTSQVHVVVDVGKLPYTPITLVFQDIRYFVPNPSKGQKTDDGNPAPDKLELLKGVTGFAVPGSMTALMGGSGAGKTTLMDVIAGRKTVGEVRGNIWVNGHPKEQGSWARSSGYVEQMDIHTPATTVLEALMFSARLRLPRETPKAAVRAYVDSVIRMVELDDVMFSLVGLSGGNSGTGLNVDARKRLTLAVELVANPSVVFMDEPTSGLDARAASIVMKAIRAVANDGRTVMVVIHQPSIEIFEAFDMLLLLQRGGRTTYFGPLGSHSKPLVDYLMGQVPGVEPLPEGYNPATWMLEVTGAAKAVRIKAVEGVDWPQVYSGSSLAASNAARAEQLIEDSRKSYPQPLVVSGKYAARAPTQFAALLFKFQMVYWRTPSYNFVRLAMTIVVALVYGSIYWNQGEMPNPASVGRVQNVMGVLYSSSSFLGMLGRPYACHRDNLS
ncbi:hypothetical protein Vretifemale_11338 [Volvox reticuliferus]|uniref:ABC transporter domain-containing protein n=1 Tax=Volvox reticuliferus TaxID=1737510 RepID=A0A8J4CGG5_9CHLO|nr:hypothetical protein Vretifemale_11338 [Volvox reticuliferus]